MGWAILAGAILAVAVVVGVAAMKVWAQFSLIRSNRSLARSYNAMAKAKRAAKRLKQD